MQRWKYAVSAALLLVAFGLWFWRWNITINESVIVPDVVYSAHEKVDFGEAFFWDDAEDADGYTISLENAAVKQTEDYLNSWNVSKNEIFPEEADSGLKFSDYVYDVTMTIKNESNTTGGVRFSDFILIHDALILRVSPELLAVSDPEIAGLTGFSLPKGVERTLNLPFTADLGIVSINEEKLYQTMKQEEFFLCFSQFPVRNLIQVPS